MSEQNALALTALEQTVEALLVSSDKPLSIEAIQQCFDDDKKPTRDALHKVMVRLAASYSGHAFELRQVASGWRIQVKQAFSDIVIKLFDEKPRKYSRAMLETLAIIAYRQPVTRGEIEEIRGVAVSSNVIRTLLERNWVRIIGHKEVPGRPAMFGSTKEFLDYFNLKTLDQLPSLAELQDIDNIRIDFDVVLPELAGLGVNTTVDENVDLKIDSKVLPHDVAPDAGPTAETSQE